MLPPTENEDPRRAKSRARVLAAAVDLLREEGLVGMTIESVAQRSGVAKTTIYRQFADRDALHHAAVSSVACAVPMEHTDDVVADVTKFCNGLNLKLRTGDFGALMPTGFEGAERSPALAKMMHDTGRERRAALLARLRAAAREGELRADIDTDLINSQLVGPLFYRRFMSRQPASPAWVAKLVEAVLNPLRAPAGDAPAGGARPR